MPQILNLKFFIVVLIGFSSPFLKLYAQTEGYKLSQRIESKIIEDQGPESEEGAKDAIDDIEDMDEKSEFVDLQEGSEQTVSQEPESSQDQFKREESTPLVEESSIETEDEPIEKTENIENTENEVLALEADNEEMESEPIEEKKIEVEEGLVEVEYLNIIYVKEEKKFILIPYRYRRTKWGAVLGLGYGLYLPSRYTPDLAPITEDYSSVYGSDGQGFATIDINIKRNLSFGSIGIDLGIGFFKNESKGLFSGTTLNLMPIKIGIQYAMDNVSVEPYYVPYISLGLYTMVYNETLGSTKFDGTTGIAGYFVGGLMFQLNRINLEGAIASYLTSEIENTFFYIEARMLLASNEKKDPDFTSDLIPNVGLKVEF